MIRKIFWTILTLILLASLGLLAWSLSEGGQKNFTHRVEFRVSNEPLDPSEKAVIDETLARRAAAVHTEPSAPAAPAAAAPAATPAARAARDDDHDPLAIAVIVTGLGLDQQIYNEITSHLPENVAVAFSVYSPELEQQVRRAKRQGREVFIEIPVPDPARPRQDLGPLAITPYMDPQMKLARVRDLLTYREFIDGFISIAPDMWISSKTSHERIRYLSSPDFAISDISSRDAVEQQIRSMKDSSGPILVFVPARPGLVRRVIENAPPGTLTLPSRLER